MASLYTIGMAVLAVAVLGLCTLAIVPPRSAHLSLRSFERRVGTPPAAVLGAASLGLLLLTLGIAASNAGGSEFGVVDGLFTVFGAFGSVGVAVGLSDRATRRPGGHQQPPRRRGRASGGGAVSRRSRRRESGATGRGPPTSPQTAAGGGTP